MIKMIKTTGLLVGLLVSLGAGPTTAAMLPPVAVNGLEWLQPVDFIGYTWGAINTVCDATTGSCNGALGDNDLTGWTWASVDDINGLFNYYIGSLALGPGPDFTSAPFTDWLSGMTTDGFLLTHIESEVRYIDGRLRDSFDTGNAYTGEMFWSAFGPEIFGSIADSSDYTPKNSLICDCADTGAWFVRDPNATAVPITNTLALLGLGLFALGCTGRKRTPATAVGVHLS